MFLLEDSPLTVKARLMAMTPNGLPDDLMVHADPFRLASENYDATRLACRGAVLVICDPVIQASEVKDWNSQQEVRDTFDLWRRLSRDTEACVTLSYHHRKMAGDFGDAMAGSVQAQATVDGILEMYRDRSLAATERKVTFIGRDWPDLQDEVVSLDTSSLIWQPAGKYSEAREAAADARKQEGAEEALDALPAGEPGFTYAEWEKATGLGKSKIKSIRTMLGERVRQAGNPQGSRSDPMRFWRTS
jgi:hypothetical protein